jgi:hypothetical protein
LTKNIPLKTKITPRPKVYNQFSEPASSESATAEANPEVEGDVEVMASPMFGKALLTVSLRLKSVCAEVVGVISSRIWA